MKNIVLKSIVLSALVFLASSSFAQDKANTRINNSEKTTLGLSKDIGKMSGQIGKMGDKIIKTQKIQSKNYNNTLNKIK